MSVNSLHFSIPNGTLEHLGVHITSSGFQPSWGREGRGDTSASTQDQGVSVGFTEEWQHPRSGQVVGRGGSAGTEVEAEVTGRQQLVEGLLETSSNQPQVF